MLLLGGVNKSLVAVDSTTRRVEGSIMVVDPSVLRDDIKRMTNTERKAAIL
jgi:hypothetical protein